MALSGIDEQPGEKRECYRISILGKRNADVEGEPNVRDPQLTQLINKQGDGNHAERPERQPSAFAMHPDAYCNDGKEADEQESHNGDQSVGMRGRRNHSRD